MSVDVSTAPGDFYQVSWEYINDNVVNLSKVLEDYLDLDTEKDINWIKRDDTGGIVEITKPNLAKIINNAISSIRGDLVSQPFVLNQTSMEAIRKDNKNTFRTSGFVSLGQTKYASYGKVNGIYSLGKDNVIIGNDVENTTYIDASPYPILHMDGYLMQYRNTNDYSMRNTVPITSIKLAPVVKDSSNVTLDLTEGDRFILADLDRELVVNGDWSDNTNGWTLYNADVSVSNGQLTVKTSDSSIVAQVTQRIYVVPGVTYKVTADFIEGSGVRILTTDDGGWISSTTYSNSINTNTDTKEYYFRSNRNYVDIQIRCYPGTAQTVVGTISLKQVKEQPVTIEMDANISGDLYTYKDTIKHMYGLDIDSQQDFVFIESWNEDITASGIDFVHPYGNTQYRGPDVDGLTGIAEGAFEGYDKYSLFSKWIDVNPIGKGYKWSDLDDVSKKKLLANKEHNIWYDQVANKYYQRKYRTRVVKSILDGLILAFPRDEHQGYPMYYNGAIWGVVNAKASKYNETEYAYGTRTDNTSSLRMYMYSSMDDVEYPDKIPGSYATNTYNPSEITHMLPVASIQRRNPGIYHPIYNPAGTAKAGVKDSNGNTVPLNWWETDTIINSLSDCYDPNKILIVKYDDSGNPVYELLANDDGTYTQTGYTDSKISGRDDGLYVDYVDDRDIEDLRPRVNNKTPREILVEEFDKLRSGYLRMSEPLTITQPLKYIGNQSNDPNKTTFYSDSSYFNYARLFGTNNITKAIVFDSNTNKVKGISSKSLSLLQVDNGYLVNRWYGLNLATDNKTISYVYGDKVLMSSTWSLNYKQTKTYQHYEYISNTSTLGNRVTYTVTSTDEVIDLTTHTYVLCNDNTNNNGTVGHMYRYKGGDITGIHTNSTDGDANVSNGHIDFSDANVWVDLGDDLTVGGIDDAIMNHTSIFELFLDGDDRMSENILARYFNGSDLLIPISARLGSGKLLGRTKDGKWIDLGTNYTIDTSQSILYIRVGNVYSTLGYNSADEAVDLGAFIYTSVRNAVFGVPSNQLYVYDKLDFTINTGSYDESDIGNLTIKKPLRDNVNMTYDDSSAILSEYPYEIDSATYTPVLNSDAVIKIDNITPRSGFNLISSLISFRPTLAAYTYGDDPKHNYFAKTYKLLLATTEHIVLDSNLTVYNQGVLEYKYKYNTRYDSSINKRVVSSKISIPLLYPTLYKKLI